MSGPRLNLVDVKFFHDVGCEVFEFDGRVDFFVLRSRDELAEGVGGNRNPLPWLGWEVKAGSGTGMGQT